MATAPPLGRAARRRRRRRRNLLLSAAVVTGVVVAGGAAALAVGGGADTHPGARASSTTNATVAVVSSAPPPTTAPTTTTTEPDPGALPQTPDKPSTSSAKFAAGVAALWQAIQRDQPDLAMPFFFPLGAYLQVKAISNPESDWHNRLVAAYVQDIHALHAQLGASASTAQLTGIDVPDAQATWVQPGAEYNKGSYWRVYQAQLRYSANGQSGAFPIASMISWRGEWYVVHLNSIR